MKKILSTILYFFITSLLLGEKISFWEHSIIDNERILRGEVSGMDIMSRFEYSVDTSQLQNLTIPDFKTGEGFLPVIEALEISYEEYFKRFGISEEEYYQMVDVSLQKVDDFTKSKTSQKFRTFPKNWRAFWFYSVKCDWFFGKDYINAAPPILVLMDGSLIRGYSKPRVEEKKKERKEFKVSERKHDKKTIKVLMRNNLMQIAALSDEYFRQKPDASSFKFSDYFEFLPVNLPITIWDGEDYDSIVVDRDWKELEIKSKSGVVSTLKNTK